MKDRVLPDVIRVSVVVPVYNVAKYLRRCLDSLVRQTLRDIEIICVDDGSTDGSGVLLDEYAAKDARIRVVHQPNAGAGPARNAGLDLARGDYLFFCDPDDWCDRQMLAKMYARAKHLDADMVFVSHFECEGDDDRVGGRRSLPRKLADLPQPFAAEDVATDIFQLFAHVPWNKLFRAVFVRENGLRFQNLPRSNDAFFVEAAIASARRIGVIDRAYYYHRIRRPGSLVAASDKNAMTGYAARDALRDYLGARGLFGQFRASWALAVCLSAFADIAAFSTTVALESSYREFRRRILEDADMREVLNHPALKGESRELYDIVAANEDTRPFLLASLHRQKKTIWRLRRRSWRLLAKLPQGLYPLIRRFVG